MDIEKKKAIYQLNTNVSFIKFMEIFILFAATACICIYIPVLYKLTGDNISDVPTLIMGFYLIPMAMNGMGFLVYWHKKQNSNIYNYYDVYTILPVKREYIIQQEFRFWKYIPIFSGVLLSITNILYFLNPVLKSISGYFVFITISTITMVVSDFFARFHRKKSGGIIKTIWMVICCLYVCLNSISVVNSAFVKFIEMDVFQYFAGVPMLILSLILIPCLFIIHYKYPYSTNRKSAAWYC